MHRYAWKDEELLGNIQRLLTDPSIHARLKRTSAYRQAHNGRRKATRHVDALLASADRKY